jgi:hypothetical protein
MEILDRYLLAVRRHLPWLRQDDIIAELRANLEAQLEDKEAELGRKLTDAEMEAWLKQMGSPLQTAARYRPQQYLIGPTLFPIYWFVLRLVMGWLAVLYLIAKTLEIVARGLGVEALAGAVFSLPWVLFLNAAMLTLIFAILERSGAKIPEKFAQGAAMGPDWTHTAVWHEEAEFGGRKKPKTYVQAVIEAIVGWIVLVWLLLVPHYPFLLMGPGVVILKAAPYQLAPVWWTFYWCVVVLNAVELGWQMIDLLQERWQQPHPPRQLVKKALGLIPLLVVLAAPRGELVVLKNPADMTHAATLAQINLWTWRGFAMVAVIAGLQLLWMAGRMSVDAYRRRLAAR